MSGHNKVAIITGAGSGAAKASSRTASASATRVARLGAEMSSQDSPIPGNSRPITIAGPASVALAGSGLSCGVTAWASLLTVTRRSGRSPCAACQARARCSRLQ